METASSALAAALGDGKAWPPGFRFHPSDEELILYYLKRKICRRRLKLDIIAETDVYKWDPEDLPGQSILKNGDRQWFFLSPRDRRYPNGRSNRATGHGYWRATGKDRSVTCNSRTIGTKKTLVFYRGRAPNGERTDWVMHEYTVDKEELERCPTEQDYYALYKVYKKSGPGPKNGEQYAAPFKEEEWADDEYSDGNSHAAIGAPVEPVNGISSMDSLRVDGQISSALDDIEEIFNQILDNQTPIQFQTGDHAYATQNVSPMIDITPSTAPQLHSYEAPEVTSTPSIPDQESHITQENITIDDFIGLETSFRDIEKPVDKLQLEELDRLNDVGLNHDEAMFLHGIGPYDQSQAANPYLNNFEDDTINQSDNHLPHPYNAEPFNSQLWTHDQNDGVNTASESCQGAIPPSFTGAACDGTSTDLRTQGNQNQAGNDNGDEDQWFSSALWAFVESIPTPTASASENALMNRRMSSLRGVRLTASNAADAARNGPPALKWKNRGKGFLYCSVIGALSAVFWVLMKGFVMNVYLR